MKLCYLCLAVAANLFVGCGDDVEVNDDLYSLTCDQVICHGASVYELSEASNVDEIDCEWDCVTFMGEDNRHVSMIFRRDTSEGVPTSCWQPYLLPQHVNQTSVSDNC